MPKRIQRKRTKGWRMPPNTVSITRPGKWGNPLQTAVNFEQLLYMAIVGELNPNHCDQCARIVRIAKDIEQLRGKDLACFCKEGDACHGDVLIELANKSA